MMTRRQFPLAAVLMTLILILATAACAPAADPVTERVWTTDAPLSGTVVDGTAILDAPQGGVYPLTVIDAPQLSGGDIVVIVDVIVGDVGSPGYLELWAVYDDGSRFFSRSYDAAGVGLLRSGRSLTIELPFALSGTVPAALEINAVVPDGGHLEIGTVALYELGGVSGLGLQDGDAWWSQQTSGLLGGVAGGLLGVLGALIGMFASRGKARRFVIGTLILGGVLGVVAAGSGIVALLVGQPYQVWFLLLLLGVILGAVFGGLVRSVSTRYQARELQKMRSHDLV